MRSRFLSDVLFVIITAFSAVALGSLIYHITGWDRESVMAGAVGGAVVCALVLRGYVKRRQQRGDFSDTQRSR